MTRRTREHKHRLPALAFLIAGRSSQTSPGRQSCSPRPSLDCLGLVLSLKKTQGDVGGRLSSCADGGRGLTLRSLCGGLRAFQRSGSVRSTTEGRRRFSWSRSTDGSARSSRWKDGRQQAGLLIGASRFAERSGRSSTFAGGKAERGSGEA